MNRAPTLLATLALAATLHAQDALPPLAPELAPLAAKYQTDLAALDGQKATEIARVAQTYVAALDAAEKMETTAGHLAAITAITQERDALKKGDVKAELPGDLPKDLRNARKTYLDGFARVIGDYAQREQRIATDYIRVLSDTQTRVGSNAALTRQITEEKKRVLKSAPAGGTADISRLFADSKWNNLGGSGSLTLHADGSVSSTWGGKGKWKVLSPTHFEMRWDNVKPQVWAIDRAARIMSLPDSADRWERQ